MEVQKQSEAISDKNREMEKHLNSLEQIKDWCSKMPLTESSLETPHKHQQRLFLRLVQCNNTTEVKKMLAKSPELIETQDNFGQTALHITVKRGYL